jgi:hypothetical protein
MERRLAGDFSSVQLHADADAAWSAAALGARAYTVGERVVFGAGEYRPGAEGYRRLLAHELSHVLQLRHASALDGLRRSPVAGPVGGESDASGHGHRRIRDDRLEREADEAAVSVMRRERAQVSAVAPAGAILAADSDTKPVSSAAEALIAAYQQKGGTCGAASLVSALIIWDRQATQAASPNQFTATACDLILAELYKRKAETTAAIARETGVEGEQPYDALAREVEAARAAARQPGGEVSEGQYQQLGIALYLMWSDQSDKVQAIQRTLGLEKSKSSVSGYDGMWNSAVLVGLLPDQIAQVDWYVRLGPDVHDPNVRIGDHAFLIGRLASGEWFLSDQAASPVARFSAPTREELRQRVDEAAFSNQYWIFPGSPSVTRAKSVHLLASPREAGPAGANAVVAPGTPLGQVDPSPVFPGDDVVSAAFITSGDDQPTVAAQLTGPGSGLLIEAAPGTFFLYHATPVSEWNLSATSLDVDGSAGGLLLERKFVHAWLILGDAAGRRGATIDAY